jgi:hypothetical protein
MTPQQSIIAEPDTCELSLDARIEMMLKGSADDEMEKTTTTRSRSPRLADALVVEPRSGMGRIIKKNSRQPFSVFILMDAN